MTRWGLPFTHAGSSPWGTLPQGVEGCEECNRTEVKLWPIFTVDYHGEEVCAKCLTPMRYPRSAARETGRS